MWQGTEGGLWSGPWSNIWQGTKSCLTRSLEVDLTSGEPYDDCGLSQQPVCNLVRDPEPEGPTKTHQDS